MLENINTIVLLMFENRSFDHMLGHLSFDGINTQVDGLRSPLSQYANVFNGDPFPPFRIKVDSALAKDPPHDKDSIAVQLDKSDANGQFLMDGFVKAYINATKVPLTPKPDPMGFFSAAQVPITSFLASTYCTCNRWFSSLPTSTQPNRTMAFCGDSSIDDTKLQLISAKGNIFDWLVDKGIKWRVYHDGLSFFTFYNDLWHFQFTDKFKDYEFLFSDFQSEPDASFPQVIVVEPSYKDAPHFGSDIPNDNHPPLAVGFGEEFLRRTYEAVTCNPARWGNTLMVVYYDEHGGFFDHVPPPAIGYTTTGGEHTQFNSLGVRVPAILVSPFVTKGSVSNVLLDHTSVLQLLAEKFTPGVPFSDNVAARMGKGIQSVSQVLTATADTTAPAAPSTPLMVKSALGDNIAVAPTEDMPMAFEKAAHDMVEAHEEEVRQKYPELSQWEHSAAIARNAAVGQRGAGL
jgi:phospholipase C